MAGSWRDSAAAEDVRELSSGAAGCEGSGDSDDRETGREHAAVFRASDIGVTRAVLFEAVATRHIHQHLDSPAIVRVFYCVRMWDDYRQRELRM